MAATHPAYNLMKIPGISGVLTMTEDTKDALQALKLAHKTAAAEQPTSADAPKAKGAVQTRKKQ